MAENDDGSGQFTSVILRPRMSITDSKRLEEAEALHAKAHKLRIIARSVNFPIWHEVIVVV